ncbi:hypothetical protein SKAU_G00084490 [Synaphobranchus kaupii]|uniref:Uncharacterized protein n=1 Tax=Synaphobranchus kaupii TaxID=118154 RepID=A0A9Q1FWB5_SYNKA|nr:hypothetical protein SKAU_G00084490 [Synaphobranchus kaupii]
MSPTCHVPALTGVTLNRSRHTRLILRGLLHLGSDRASCVEVNGELPLVSGCPRSKLNLRTTPTAAARGDRHRHPLASNWPCACRSERAINFDCTTA